MRDDNIIGKKFGRLLVVEYDRYDESQRSSRYLCRCDCGNIISVRRVSLTGGSQVSCKCSRLYDRITGDIQSNNTSGHKGVSFNKRRQKYEAYIQLNRRKMSLGCFEKFEDAVKARLVAEDEYFKPIITSREEGSIL